MNGLVRAAVSGAAGVFISDMVQPHLDKILKPESDFGKKAARAGAAAVGTAGAWYLTGFFGK